MSNVLDLLLQVDESKLKRPMKEVDIKRLSEATGSKVVFKCEALTLDQFDDIKNNSIRNNEIDMNDMHIFTLLEGVKEPNLKSKELRDRFRAATPKEFIKILLLPGEISELYNIISELSGFADGVVEEIKN